MYNTIRVPEDVRSVTHYRPEDEVEPADAGMSKKGVGAIWSAVEGLYRTGIHPGISLCLRRHGKVVLKRAIGHARGNGPADDPYADKVPLTPETPICIFSASKAVTAMLIHFLVERGQINITDPINHYIPEFNSYGKEEITIYQILSHRGGVQVLPNTIEPEIVFDHDAFTQLLYKSKQVTRGGKRIAYHAITGGFILGEIVRRVTGKDLRQLLVEIMRRPLGFRYFNYGVDEKDVNKVALNYYTGWPVIFPFSTYTKRVLGASWRETVHISDDPRFMKEIIPSGNMVATADEMSRFFQLLLNGGELDGIRIFEPDTIRHATRETGRVEIDRMVLLPMRYSAGFILGSSPMGMYGPYTQHSFGHLGFSNIICWADYERDIVVSLLNTGKALMGTHLIKLFRLLARISRYCRER